MRIMTQPPFFSRAAVVLMWGRVVSENLEILKISLPLSPSVV